MFETKVQKEIEALHEFFIGWFSGVLPITVFETEFVSRFDQDFLLIPPAGSLMTLDELRAVLYRGHATNPNFKIAIRNVKIRQVFDSHILVTYEEWQRNALASTPPDNARLATVIFKITQSLQWLHVHETWLPKAVTSAERYDF